MTPGSIRRNQCASSVVLEFLVAPVAHATPWSLLCISCLLHVEIHPDRSARFARFARSLAALALPTSIRLCTPCDHLGPSWPVLVLLKLPRQHKEHPRGLQDTSRAPARMPKTRPKGLKTSPDIQKNNVFLCFFIVFTSQGFRSTSWQILAHIAFQDTSKTSRRARRHSQERPRHPQDRP